MPDAPTFDRLLLTMRIIHGALCTGLVALTAVLAGQRMANNQPPAALPLISYIGFGVAAVCLILSFVVPNLVQAGWRRRIAAGQSPLLNDSTADRESLWLVLYQTRLILGMAMLEGAAFMQVIAFFVEGVPLSLGVALGLLVVMLTRFPTRAGVESWITAQREQVEMLKQDRV